jgi:hypothetical protein
MTNVVRFPSELAFSQYRILYQSKGLPALLLEVATYLADRAENNPPWEAEKVYWLFKCLKTVSITDDMHKLADKYIVYAESLMSNKGERENAIDEE